MSAIGECFFLDVGQGTSQVIVLPDRSAIIIDCGPSFEVLGDLLKRRLGVTRIKLLIISHNHHDHIGCLPDLLRNFRNSIDEIRILQDQPAKSLMDQEAFTALVQESKNRNCPEPRPLYRERTDGVLYQSNLMRLEVLFPSFWENLQSQESSDANQSCAVLVLHCGERRILFSGDAKISVWNSIYERRGLKAIECDVAAIPHHGGEVIRPRKSAETVDEHHINIKSDLARLYGKIIHCKVGIVSVGTDFQYKHPIPPHIEAVRDGGACVMCTQITERCSADLESLRPGVLDSDGHPRKSKSAAAKTSTGRSKDVACAGTILVEISPVEIKVLRHAEHQTAIDAKLLKPLCRIPLSPTPTGR